MKNLSTLFVLQHLKKNDLLICSDLPIKRGGPNKRGGAKAPRTNWSSFAIWCLLNGVGVQSLIVSIASYYVNAYFLRINGYFTHYIHHKTSLNTITGYYNLYNSIKLFFLDASWDRRAPRTNWPDFASWCLINGCVQIHPGQVESAPPPFNRQVRVP